MYVFDTDTLAFLEVNDAAADYYGYPRQELLARTSPGCAWPKTWPP